MKVHIPFVRHDKTAYVRMELLNAERRTLQCSACGECVTACPRNVLSVMGPVVHRHVHVDRAKDCIGCLACVRACPHGVIRTQIGQARRLSASHH